MGEINTALHLIEPLQKLAWSEIYYPNMPDALARFVEQLKNPDTTERKDEENSK